MNAQISLFFCKSTRWFLKFCGLSCCWNEKRKRKCKKVIPTTTKTSRKKGEEPHFLCQQNYLQLTLKLSKWKVTTTRTVTFHRHSECPISYLPYFRKQFPRKLFFVELSLMYSLWHFRLWSFQGRDTKLERFLAKNQLYSNEITKFWELE